MSDKDNRDEYLNDGFDTESDWGDLDDGSGSDWGDLDEDSDEYRSSVRLDYSKWIQTTTIKKDHNENKTQQNSKIIKWTCSDIIAFIISLDPEYEKYKSLLSTEFTRQNVKGSSLFLIREDHLKSFGISDPDHCTAIYVKIQQLIEKDREDCKKITFMQRSRKIFYESMEKIRSQKDSIKQFNPSRYTPLMLKILYSGSGIKCESYQIGYPLGFFEKCQNFSNYHYLLDYYNYIRLVDALHQWMLMYLNLFLICVIQSHIVYIISIIFGYFCNSGLQCHMFKPDALYRLDHLVITIMKTPVSMLHNSIIKLQEYGILSYDKWIFREHGFYPDHCDYWCYWIYYDINKIPQDIHQITGIKSSWLENNGWDKLSIEGYESLVALADILDNQIDFWLGRVTIQVNLEIAKLSPSSLFAYEYLMVIGYILWLSIIITMISGIT